MTNEMMNVFEPEAITQETSINRESFPMLLGAKDAARLGISKSMYYRLTHMADLPTIMIGSRRYLHRDRFFEWMDQATEYPN